MCAVRLLSYRCLIIVYVLFRFICCRTVLRGEMQYMLLTFRAKYVSFYLIYWIISVCLELFGDETCSTFAKHLPLTTSFLLAVLHNAQAAVFRLLGSIFKGFSSHKGDTLHQRGLKFGTEESTSSTPNFTPIDTRKMMAAITFSFTVSANLPLLRNLV